MQLCRDLTSASSLLDTIARQQVGGLALPDARNVILHEGGTFLLTAMHTYRQFSSQEQPGLKVPQLSPNFLVFPAPHAVEVSIIHRLHNNANKTSKAPTYCGVVEEVWRGVIGQGRTRTAREIGSALQ